MELGIVGCLVIWYMGCRDRRVRGSRPALAISKVRVHPELHVPKSSGRQIQQFQTGQTIGVRDWELACK